MAAESRKRGQRLCRQDSAGSVEESGKCLGTGWGGLVVEHFFILLHKMHQGKKMLRLRLRLRITLSLKYMHTLTRRITIAIAACIVAMELGRSIAEVTDETGPEPPHGISLKKQLKSDIYVALSP